MSFRKLLIRNLFLFLTTDSGLQPSGMTIFLLTGIMAFFIHTDFLYLQKKYPSETTPGNGKTLAGPPA